MTLNQQELDALKANHLSIQNAMDLANHIESDPTVGGIFPQAKAGDFTNADIEKFKSKWGGWWPVARILLIIAKAFTNDNTDKVIDQIIKIGDEIYHPQPAQV